MPDITGDRRPDCGGTRRKRVFPRVCKADRQIAVAFGSSLNATTRGPQWSHPSYPLLVSVDGAHAPLVPTSSPTTLHGRGLSGGSSARSPLEKEPSAAENDRSGAAARTRPCGDGAMTEALSVSLRLSSDAVVRQDSPRSRLGLSIFLSFFPPISPSLYLASLCRGGLSNSPQGRRRWRRFLAHARAWRQDDCQKRTRTKRATLRFCERKRDRFRLGPRWDRPRFHEQARGRPSSHFVSRWVENHSHFRLLRKERCLNAASLHGSVVNYALSSAMIMNLFEAPRCLTAAFWSRRVQFETVCNLAAIARAASRRLPIPPLIAAIIYASIVENYYCGCCSVGKPRTRLSILVGEKYNYCALFQRVYYRPAASHVCFFPRLHFRLIDFVHVASCT